MSNIFFPDENRQLTLDDYLRYDKNSRENLGSELPVLVYRMLEFSMKCELTRRFDRETQIEIFRCAGREAGEFFARKMLNLDQPLDSFISELQRKIQEFKIGVLRIEYADEETGKLILTVSEDADCSGLPILGETVCNYDEGFIAGILSVYSGKPYTAIEVDCWATGDRVCRFHANIDENQK